MNSSVLAGHDQTHVGLRRATRAAPRVNCVIDDQRVDVAQLAQKRQRLPADLGVVGHDHHLVGTAHHLPFRLDQQQVAVEQPLAP